MSNTQIEPDGTIRLTRDDEVKDLCRLLNRLCETALALPQSEERDNAFLQIRQFQTRLAALVHRAGTSALVNSSLPLLT